MLALLRRKSQSKFIQATIVVIILVFIFWGVGANQGNGRNDIATVNGQSIPLQDYQKEYDRMISSLRDQFGGSIPKGLLEATDFKKQVVNKLVQASLMRQGGKDVGLYVSDIELQENIQEMEAFKNNGVFDVDWYEQVLTGSRMTVPSFEASMRYDLLYAKIIDHLGRFGQVSDNEIAALFHYKFSQKSLQYVTLKAADFKEKVTVDDEKLAAYFKEHRDTYKSAPQVKLKYINIPTSGEGLSVTFSDDEILQSYKANIQRFTHPEERQASHILIKSGESDQPEQIAAKKKIIEDILLKAKGDEDFAELAKQFSEDGSASRGGDLGFFQKGQMVKPFEDAAYSLEEGGISDIVQTQFGFHILKLNKIKASGIRPLEEVQAQITAQLKKEKLGNIVFKKANETYEAIILSGSLNNYASKETATGEPQKLTISETEFFSQQDPPVALRTSPALVNAAFSMKKGELSSIIDTGQGYAIVFIEDRKKPVQEELANVREKVKGDFIAQESLKLAKTSAEELLKRLKNGADLTQEAETMKLTLETTNFVSRDTLSDSSLSPQIIQAHFNLSEANRYAEKVVPEGETFFVIAFKDSKEPDQDTFASKKEDLTRQLVQAKSETLLSAWVGYLREKADITVNEKLL